MTQVSSHHAIYAVETKTLSGHRQGWSLHLQSFAAWTQVEDNQKHSAMIENRIIVRSFIQLTIANIFNNSNTHLRQKCLLFLSFFLSLSSFDHRCIVQDQQVYTSPQTYTHRYMYTSNSGRRDQELCQYIYIYIYTYLASLNRAHMYKTR